MPKIRIEKATEEKLKKLDVKNWSPWECEPSTFDWQYDCDESAYVLEGKVKVKTPEEEVEINKGDIVHFPKGMKCTWKIIEKIRKVYTFK
ncbi:MAG: cupin domain-containing protein [Candidatus Omnitrophota bacterium]